jgi:hypothetical protein
VFFLTAAALRKTEEHAARKAAKKAEKARQTEAAVIQPQPAPPNTQNAQFYSQLHSSAAPLYHAAVFTDTRHSSPAAPVFQGSNLTFPPRNVGWNPNEYVGPQSATPSNEIQPWNQHHGPQTSPSSSLSTMSNLPGNQNFMGKQSLL